jgi:hypothetical protein
VSDQSDISPKVDSTWSFCRYGGLILTHDEVGKWSQPKYGNANEVGLT